MRILYMCLLFVNFNTTSLVAEIVWHKGSIVLQTKEVLVGELSVDPLHQIVLIKQADETVSVFSPDKIIQICFYDEAANINRRYITHQTNAFPARFSLLEVVLAGEVIVLRSQKTGTTWSNSDRDDFDYVIIFQERLFPLRQFRTKVFPALQEKHGMKLESFIQRNRFSVNEPADCIGIIQFYNKLSITPHQVAMQ